MNWRKQHKWSGISAAFLLLIFCVSGIILNHREAVSGMEVSRSVLPPWYKFHNWNGGLLRGTLPYGDKVLIYGSNGVWLTDSAAGNVGDFNAGLPEGTDNRQIRALAETSDGLYALSPGGLYRLKGGRWHEVSLPVEEGERLSDMTAKGDTLAVIGRSNLYVSTNAGGDFHKVQPKTSPEQDGKVTLFRTVWMLHSGELFGIVGKIIVDIIAGILALLSVTGIVFWLLPKTIHRRVKAGKKITAHASVLKTNLRLHNKIGVLTIVLTLLAVVTGWLLRPPGMIPLALTKTEPVPGTELDSENPWHDKLRMVRYDEKCGDWLLSTSDGFYSMTELDSSPEKEGKTPPVSVMGLNVWERADSGEWLCGSFSGMYRWDRQSGKSTDYHTGKAAPQTSGPPFGKFAVSGYSKEFNTVVEYNDGTADIKQPEELKNLPMSLWGVALEAHSGRIFIGQSATYIFIFITGLIIVWALVSGYKIRRKK
ncbi:MAG: PepSY domain-containing protein [Prevotella sp.]|nr:PepSY domain-containing protein [Prevotella sp.]MCM1074562.1 PepSY domain-containing protein [Ruminococcus sp.]